jgi:hypothetical protein
MKKHNENENILPPLPRVPKARDEGNSRRMEWKATLARPILAAERDELAALLVQSRCQISVEYVTPRRVIIEVVQSPIGDYTELYDASLRSLYLLEKTVGTLLSIEGQSREKWDKQFMFARRFGALE